MAAALPVTQGCLGDINPASLVLELSAFVAEAAVLAQAICPAEYGVITTIDWLIRPEYAIADLAQARKLTLDEKLILKEEAATAEEQVIACWGYFNLARSFIEVLELMNGFGVPDPGYEFNDGVKNFSKDIYDELQGATATGWSGAPHGAAYNYNCRNREQQARAQQIAETDNAIVGILSDQSFQVEQVRQGLAGTRMMLIGASAFVASLELKTLIEIRRSESGDYAAILNALEDLHFLAFIVDLISLFAAISALVLTSVLIDEGRKNAKSIADATSGYSKIFEEISAYLSRAAVPGMSRSAAAPESHAPSFTGIAEKLSERVAHFAVDSGATGSGNGPLPVAASTQARGMSPAARRPSPGPGLAQGGRAAAISVKRAHEEKAAASLAADAAHQPGVPVDVATTTATGVEGPRQEVTWAERMGFSVQRTVPAGEGSGFL